MLLRGVLIYTSISGGRLCSRELGKQPNTPFINPLQPPNPLVPPFLPRRLQSGDPTPRSVLCL